MRRTIALAALLVSACAGDETLTAYGAAGPVWDLVETHGRPAETGFALTFPEPGQVSGQAPCGSFAGAVGAPYPWFAVTLSDLQGCRTDDAFLRQLRSMTQAELSGGHLVLRDDAGREMVFRARQRP